MLVADKRLVLILQSPLQLGTSSKFTVKLIKGKETTLDKLSFMAIVYRNLHQYYAPYYAAPLRQRQQEFLRPQKPDT